MAGGTEIRNIVYNIRSLTAKETSKIITGLNTKWGNLNRKILESRTRIAGFNEELVYTIDELAEVAKYVDKLDGKLGNLTSGSNAAANALENISNETDQLVNSAVQTNKTLGSMLDVLNDMNSTAATAASAAAGTEEAIERMGKEASSSGRKIDKFGNQIKQAGNKGKGATKEFAGLRSAMGGGGIVGIYANIAANIFVLVSAFNALKVAASTIQLQENLSALSEGHNLRALATELQNATDGALSMDKALRTAAEATAFGFDASQITELAVAARQASIALGRDFGDTLNRLTKGIAKQEVELLDELGIVTRLEPAMKKYAAAKGTTVQALTDVERKTALYNESLVQLEENFGRINSRSTEFDKLAANLATSWEATTKSLIPYLSISLEFWNEMLIGPKAARDELASYEGALQASKGAFESLVNATKKDSPFLQSKAYTEAAQAVRTLEEELVKLASPLKRTDAANEKLRGILESSKSQDLANGSVKGFDNDAAKREIELLDKRKAIQADINKLKIITRGVSIDELATLRDLNKGFKDSNIQLSGFGAKAKQNLVPLQEQLEQAQGMVKSFKAATEAGLGGTTNLIATQDKYIESIQNNLGITVSSVGEYADNLAIASAHLNNLAGQNRVIAKETLFKDKSEQLTRKMANNELLIVELQKVGLVTLAAKFTKENAILKINREMGLLENEKARTFANIEKSSALQLMNSVLGSDSLQIQMNAVEAKLSFESEYLSIMEKESLLRDKEVLAEQKKLALIKERMATEKAMFDRQSALAGLDATTRGLPASAAAGLDKQAAQFALAQATETGVQIDIETAKTALLLAQKKEEIELIKEKFQLSSGGKASAALTGLFGNQDLADNAANKALGNDEAVWQNAADGVQTALDALASLDTATGQIASGFMSLGQIMSQSMTNGSFGADAAAASIGAVSGIMSGQSAQAVSDIDHQIAMEKKRDGQSAKSVAKLKQLEAKKLKEQQKSKLQSAVMSTAAGIASALELPFPMNLVAAGITGAMGLMQVSAIRSQGKNASALSNAGSSPQSISFGDRMNNVDLSQNSSAGERAFVTGQSGSGTSANNFVGAAAGRDVDGGTSIQVGERGAEVFIPEVPGTIVPSGNSSGGSNGGGINIAMNIDNMDAQSLIDRKDEIMDALDAAIRAKYGKSLEDF